MTTASSEVMKWLSKNRYWVRGSAAMAEKDAAGISRNSHNCLTGGVLRVPGDQQSRFHQLYVDDCLAGHTFYFSENFTTVYRACFDLDFESVKDSAVDSNQNLAAAYAVVIKTMRKFYPLDEPAKTFQCIVCLAPLKDVPETVDKPAHVKTGVHLVFPHLFITKDQALHMVAAVTEELETELGPRCTPCDTSKHHPSLAVMRLPSSLGAGHETDRKAAWTANSWKDVCDATIHQQGNLRLPMSDKPSRCGVCDNHPASKAGGPSVCGNSLCKRQRLPQNRVYTAWGVMGLDGKWDYPAFNRITRNPHCVMEMTSVRMPHRSRPSRGFKPFEGCPAPVPKSGVTVAGSKRGGKGAKAGSGGAGAAKSRGDGPSLRAHAKSGTNRYLEELDPRAVAMLEMVRLIHPKYKDVRCSQAVLNHKSSGDMVYLFKIRGNGAKYCLNKQDEHNSSTVWFMFTPQGVTQRCWCKKPDMRVSGVTCPSYRSGLMTVPMNLLRVLYPDMTTGSTIKGVYSKSGRRRKAAGVLGGTSSCCQRLHSQAQRERWATDCKGAKLDAIESEAVKNKNAAVAAHWKDLQERSKRAHAAKTGKVFQPKTTAVVSAVVSAVVTDASQAPKPSAMPTKRKSTTELSRMTPAARDAYENSVRVAATAMQMSS